MIARRHVFHVAGYDPIDAAGQHRRFRRELAKFAQTWSVTATTSDLRPSADGAFARWSVTTRGPNWTVETTYEPLDWHDIVLADFARPEIGRLVDGFVAFADFLRSGTLWRYFSASHRYALFFLVPFLDVILFACAGAFIGYIIAGASSLGGIYRALASVPIAIAAFALLLRWPGRRWRVSQALADWIFAREYMYGRRSDMDLRLDAFADRLIACVRQDKVDEIVIVGHSLGATLVLDMLTRALARDPDLGRHGSSLCVLAVGATIPKLALHPAGARLRDCASVVAAEPSIAWAEYQARDDAISFYKFHPVSLRHIEESVGKPLIRRVQLHEMLAPSTFRRHRLKFMRMHYQFVMANERRAAYDYLMMVCGPVPFMQTVLAPGGPVDAIAPDGSYVSRASAPALCGQDAPVSSSRADVT